MFYRVVDCRKEKGLFKNNYLVQQDTWVKQVLDELDTKPICSNMVFEFKNFPPEEIESYKILQKEIAKKIPEEQNRPTIILRIRGQDAHSELADCAYAGGTGPISDSEIITSVVNKIRDQNAQRTFSADLFSAPPPRGKNMAKEMGPYLHRLAKRVFTRDSYAGTWYLCSNTAHINIGVFEKLLKVNQLKNASIDDLVDNIVQHMDKKAENKPILILGTDVAAKARLYPKRLEQIGRAGVLPDLSEQIQLQQYIDAIKGGGLEGDKGDDLGKEFVEFIEKLYEKYSKNGLGGIAYTCTEIPYCLHKVNSKGKAFGEPLHHLPVPTFDSEELMVNRMVEMHQQKQLTKAPVVIGAKPKLQRQNALLFQKDESGDSQKTRLLEREKAMWNIMVQGEEKPTSRSPSPEERSRSHNRSPSPKEEKSRSGHRSPSSKDGKARSDSSSPTSKDHKKRSDSRSPSPKDRRERAGSKSHSPKKERTSPKKSQRPR